MYVCVSGMCMCECMCVCDHVCMNVYVYMHVRVIPMTLKLHAISFKETALSPFPPFIH